ncbi:hypothetical protein RB202_08195 [Micrococcus yunnanensis]|uniref:hypothetical protein n=1 Tax=Micrococcus TaxID=1269 RepID=UPI003014EA49
MKRLSPIALTAAVALTASGCAGDSYANKDMPARLDGGEITAADIKDSGEKLEPEELVEAWEDVTGETCAGDINKSSDPLEKFAECSDSTIMWSLADANDVREKVYNQDMRLTGITGSDWLVGPNWVINTTGDQEALFHKIGGQPVRVGD